MATIIGANQGITHIDLSIDNGTRNYQMQIALGTFPHLVQKSLFIDKQNKKRLIMYSNSYTEYNRTATAVSGIGISGPAVLLTADETEDELRGL
jgi:hypothetical protein